MTDYYTEDIARLQGQPKRTIGDYVESQGILVPRRFATLQEARNSGLPIIARSEHSQDYSGASGIVGSANLSWDDYKDIQSEEELRDKVMADPEYGIKMYKQLCRFSQGDEKKFKSEVSFSFWELLEGYNRTIVADSAVKGRYHVMTYLAPILKPEEKRSSLYNYAIVENGLIVQEFIKPLTSDLKEGLPKIIEFYESVRNLGKFDPNHCPIMEIQTIGDKNYFLQYHRTINRDLSTFSLDRELENGEYLAKFVRGTTKPEGIILNVAMYYPEYKIEDEEASFDFHYNDSFSQIMGRKRIANFSEKEMNRLATHMAS